MTTPTLLDRAREALRGRLYELLESDDYGVHGSDFYRCPECECESGAGVLNNGIQHEVDCTIGKDFQLIADLDRARAATKMTAIGLLSIQRFRGSDAMLNHNFELYETLPDGNYRLYLEQTDSPPIATESTSQEVGNG